jgi:LysM repeat protein
MRSAHGWLVTAAGIALCILGTGCITFPDPEEDARVQAEAMRQRQAYEQLRVEVLQLRERVAALETVKEDQARQVDRLQADIADTRRVVRELGELAGGLQQSLKRLETAQGRMRTEIVDEISRNVEKLLKEHEAKAPPPPPPVKAVTGYEHVVKKGETLTKIAEAYRVSLTAILEANKLKESDPLLVGQKLFIPAP